ncbi:protein MEN-8 [Ricinus communis]|uniref:MEN-8 protein, putative n=1 Tax=Ricinus communis TaxID=3988 RepID=B9R9F7_RICCO|nr:protein MEN-8 [Ricinus communis]EEF51434.1 MEN-8 protein precursor, putative [Ricinus communis]|eukprot:XP_002510832.1 protein MEN-8 [Ricinus communis]
MAALRSLIALSSQAALLLLLVALAMQTHLVHSQTCQNQLNSLNVCAPFVVPGAANTSPNAECCNALESVQNDCICNTLRIAGRLPSLCNLSPINCGN